MVTSEKRLQRWLHTFVGMMRGRCNTCLSQRKDGSFVPKVDYKSQATAAKSALRLTEKWGKPFDAYRCFFCKGWHVGGAANLTFGKFVSIALVWAFGKRRAGNKYRLKPYRRIKTVVECQRCHKHTLATIMSMFNTEEICMECKEAEKQRPDYDAAVKADEAAIRSGDFNFKGISLK
jgi:hypothetical protein